jgi:hypothetical protein
MKISFDFLIFIRKKTKEKFQSIFENDRNDKDMVVCNTARLILILQISGDSYCS